MKEQVTNVQVRKRLLATLAIFSFIFIILFVRLFWIQFFKSDEFLNKAQAQWTRLLTVQPMRGQIYDRNGQLLAGSATADTILVIPAEVREGEKENPGLVDEMSRNLAEVLGMEEETVRDRITREASQVYLKRKVDEEVAQKVLELDYPGIWTTIESKRFYPNGSFASHILGFAGIDEGLEGIEFQYEKELAGEPGAIVYQSDARGRELPDGIQRFVPPKDGLDLVLTIDSRIQHIMERELKKAMIAHEPKSAGAIAVNPQTGEILGLAKMPDYDPGNYADYPQDNWRNPLISNSFEPGSTFKIITLAAGLEENVFSPQDTYYCDGYYEVAGRKIGCWRRHRGGHGLQTYVEVTENSCNPGFIRLGLDLGAEKLFQYINGFGFGKRTGIDLPGEQTGILFDTESPTFSSVDLAVSSFGQGNAVTPIQQVMGVAAVINGGTLMQPYIAKEFYDSEGNLVKVNEPTPIRRVISEETSKDLVDILESVVVNGSGKFGAVDNYTMGGKTGTAQKISPDGGYLPGSFILSFVGFAPVEDPQIVLYVMVDEPSIGPQWGSQVAAPIAKQILTDVLKVMNVPPNAAEIENEPPQLGIIPNLINQTIEEAIGTLEMKGFNLQIEGEGDYIIAQTPKAGTQMPINSNIIVYTSGSQGAEGEEEITVPNLKGKTVREVKDILGLLNLNVEIKGSGIAVDQRPLAGERVKANSTIVVEFTP